MFWLALPVLLAAVAPPSSGAQIYAAACSSCHGAYQYGGADAPSLHGVGMASLDFQLMTGRMPAAVPWIEVEHRDERSGQGLPLADVRALEAYLAPIVQGGPDLPIVTAGGNVDHGRSLFQLNCQGCHAVDGNGGDLGGIDWAPSLHRAPITVVADAIRAGPDQMPRFGPHQFDQRDLNDVATFVMQLQTPPAPAPPPFRSTGPVPEGAVGYLGLIALIAFVFTFWRSEQKKGT